MYPGWVFGEGWDSNDPILLKRKYYWKICNERKVHAPICIRWYRGIKLNVYLGNDSSRCIYINGCYEPNEFYFLDRVLKPGMICLDGGANDGLYSLFMAKIVGPTGRVLCFEPSPRELKRLKDNIALNEMTQADVRGLALSDRAGTMSLRIADFEHEGQNTLGEFVHQGIVTKESTAVDLTTIDEVVKGARLERVDAIKLDIEGAELLALQGGAETLEKYRPFLLLELNAEALKQQGASAEAVLDFLGKRNYRIHVFDKSTGVCRAHDGSAEDLSSNIVAVHLDERRFKMPVS